MDIQPLIQRVSDREYKIGVIGLGYVGLPLMWTFHQAGLPVIGYDIDPVKVDKLNEGIPYIKHLGLEMMGTLAKSDRCQATTDFSNRCHIIGRKLYSIWNIPLCNGRGMALA